MNAGLILSKCLNDRETCKKIFDFLSEKYQHVDILNEIFIFSYDVDKIKDCTSISDVKKQTRTYLSNIKMGEELPIDVYQYHMDNIENFVGDVIQTIAFCNIEISTALKHAKMYFYVSHVQIDELELVDIYFSWHMRHPKVLLDCLLKKQNPSEQFKKYMKKKGYSI